MVKNFVAFGWMGAIRHTTNVLFLKAANVHIAVSNVGTCQH